MTTALVTLLSSHRRATAAVTIGCLLGACLGRILCDGSGRSRLPHHDQERQSCGPVAGRQRESETRSVDIQGRPPLIGFDVTNVPRRPASGLVSV